MERRVICLDTNYLILGLTEGSVEARQLTQWHKRGERLATPAIAWYEFLCGPVDQDHQEVMRAFLNGGILPFDELHGRESARLFNLSGRVRRLRVDAMIAATALLANAQLATNNQDDFAVFQPFGLKLL